VEWRRGDRGWRLQLAFADGRGQTVYVEPEEDRVLIYSICCHATPEHHEYALRLNAEMEHGALAIRAVDGVDEFVMVDTYPLATIDVEGVRRSVLEVAHRADEVEHKLTGRDLN
jgi:serine/threonine-protein kinase